MVTSHKHVDEIRADLAAGKIIIYFSGGGTRILTKVNSDGTFEELNFFETEKSGKQTREALAPYGHFQYTAVEPSVVKKMVGRSLPEVHEAIPSSVEPPSTGERRARERGVARPEEVQVPLREKLARAVESQEKETSIALLKEMGYDGSAIYALTEKHHKVRSLGIINDIVRLPPSMTPLFLKLQEKYPQTAFDQFESLARLYELSQQTGKTVPEEQWLRLADEFAEGDVRAAAANSLGAVTRRSALEATIHRLQLLDKAFDVQRDSLKHRDEVYRTWRVGDQYELSLHRGQLESSAGLELRLYKKGEEPILLGRVGFQMTDAAIEIVHYQGGRLREAANPLRDGFKDFSGGVGPMEWLAFVTGRFLLDASKSLNTELRFLDGQWVPGCYPHPPGSLTPGMHSIKEAKAYPWKSASLPTWLQKLRDSLPALRSELENPSEPEFMTEPIDKWRARQQWKIDGIERALAMHQEGPRTIERYRAIAGKLGFKRKTQKQTWLRFTKAPEDFGKAVRKTSSNPAAFDASVRNVIKAIETSSKPTPEKIVESVEKVYPQAAEPVGFFGKIAEGNLRGALAVIRGWFGGSEARTDGNRILEQMYNEGKLTLEREADKDNGILQAKLEHILESEGIRSFEDYVQFLHSEAAKAQPINVQIGERGEVKVIIDGNTRMLGAMEMGIDPKDIPVLYGDFPMDAQHIQPNTTLDVVLQIAQSRTAE
jgi:hypothetical protein